MAVETHLVEGTTPRLFSEVHAPDAGTAGPGRPVLLIHGFASSTKLNWEDTGWIPALTGAGRTVITVDLPGHGRSPAAAERDGYLPSRLRAELLQLLQDAGVRPLAEGEEASGVDIIGYSLGSRLAWEFGATQPELVRRMVLGGPGSGDPLSEFDLEGARRELAGGAPVQDPRTAELLRMAQLVPGNDLPALLQLVEAVKQEPFTPAALVPDMPLLLVAGDRDELAATAPELVDLSGRAELLLLPARTHANAVTSRAFKTAAVAFLAA